MPRFVRFLLPVAVALIVLVPLAGVAGSGGGPKIPASQNLHQQGSSGQTAFANYDLAFGGEIVAQATGDGFRLMKTAPGNPKQISEVHGCGNGTFAGTGGDVIISGDLLVRAADLPAPAGGAACGGAATPQGEAGLQLFDIGDPKNPVGLAFVPVQQGSLTLTAVPDPENDRLVVYSSSSAAKPGFDVVVIPLSDPAGAHVHRFEPAGRACRDTAVILGDVLRVVCAGGDGFTVWSLDPADGGSLLDPEFLYMRSVPGVTDAGSAGFSWDGKTLIFGHSPANGTEPRCQAGGSEVDRSLFFFDTKTGVELGRYAMPRAQTAEENCALNKFNVASTDQFDVLVSGNYQSGIAVVNFTDPAHPVEIGYADPAPLAPTQFGGDWASYWYDGHVYESDITKGLRVWTVSGKEVGGGTTLGHLNPQTQETTFELEHEPADRELTGSFELVGHDPLMNRGMNAAMAVYGDYAYIGSRTDGKNNNANNAGIMIVDISDPTAPHVVHQMGPPLEGNRGESSREIRIWRAQEIMVVLHTNCGGNGQHQCQSPMVNNFRFYDISGEFAANPRLIRTLNFNTHEFFIWEDPFDPERAFMIAGSAGSSWQIWNISPVVNGLAPTLLRNSGYGYTSPAGGLHSLSVSNDGTRAYFALLAGGFAVADISDYTAGKPSPQYRMITPNSGRPLWPGPGAHSAIKFWDRDWAYVSDEVYGSITAAGHGCPWGWARMVDISDPAKPVVRAEYREPENQPFNCPEFEPRPRTSFSAHNPTLTPNIAFSTWHSNGFEAIDIEDPTYPYQLAEFKPQPLDAVALEDPRLSSDDQKVVMWSYPIIQDGLIYVVDLRNGLYILEYDGHLNDEVDEISFLEGNSNQGNALCYEPVVKPKVNPDDPDELYIPDYCGDVVGGGGGEIGGSDGSVALEVTAAQIEASEEEHDKATKEGKNDNGLHAGH